MLIRNFALWITLAGILGVALGGSLAWCFLPPAHSPNYRGHDANHEAGKGKRGAEPTLSSSDQRHTSHEKDREQGEAPKSLAGPEWFVVWVTLLLAFITAVLSFYTALLYRSTRQIATDSAAVAATEFIAAHRARLRVRYFKLIQRGAGQPPIVRFSIINIGDTEGHMTSCRGIIEWLDPKKLPPVVTIAMKEASPPCRFTVGQAEETTFEVPPDPRGRRPISAFSEEFRLIPIVYGLIEYSDKTGSSVWRTAFCRHLADTSGRFVAVADPDYEYED